MPLLLVLVVVTPALTMPGNDGLGARVAESARNEGLGFAVTDLERLQYWASPPRTGGSPDSADVLSLAQAATAARLAAKPAGSKAPGVAVQPAIKPLVSPALAGEGVYVPRVRVHGLPAVQVAHLRPDRTHTSYLAGVAWMSSALLRFVQHPGASDPGNLSHWDQPPSVPASARSGLAATFNSGFKISDARGAFYQNGHTVGTFRKGAASLVVYADGHVNIGSWGRDVRMTSKVVSVRQNLDLLVSGGRLTAETLGDSRVAWGATIGAKAYVWRSGIGVTATGDVVFVAGAALSGRTLGGLLQAAGAVRAMELDINPSWISFMWYTPGSRPSAPVPHKLAPFARPADRYFASNTRDFFAVYQR